MYTQQPHVVQCGPSDCNVFLQTSRSPHTAFLHTDLNFLQISKFYVTF